MSVYAFHDDKSKCNLDDYLDKTSDNYNSIQTMSDAIDGITGDIGDINGDIQTLQNQVIGIEKGGTSGTTARAARRALGLNYDSGDIISGTFYGAGYVTGGGKYFVFEIPLSKVIDGDLFLVNIEVTIRQSGYYIFGSAGTDSSIPEDVKSITTITKIDGGIRVELRPSSTPAHTVNNDVFAVVCVARINIV